MAGESKGGEERRELETLTLQKVAEFSSAIDSVTHVHEVICALHSLASLLFPVDTSVLSGLIDQPFRNQIISATSLTCAERNRWRDAFYSGSAFPTMARLLLYNVAVKWLAQFPAPARSEIYDSFFVKGPSSEIVQALIPALNKKESNKDSDLETICSNIERLLILCLLENKGIHCLVGEFGTLERNINGIIQPDKLEFISRVAQLLASIPDKARLKSSSKLSSSSFFKQATTQLITGAEERAKVLLSENCVTDKAGLDPAFLFVGETFSRVCRRGSTGILVSEMVPRMCIHIRIHTSSDSKTDIPLVIKSNFKSLLWLILIESIKDQYSVERLTEEVLRQLAWRDMSDREAYWILWLLFHRSFERIAAIRAMFVETFLLWKVFPLCSLRWILHYSVFEFPPNSDQNLQGQKTPNFINTVQRLVSTWSRREFVQSSPMEQQAYVTAAVGICLEKMSKKDLEATKDVLNSILQGVSCRLESPIDLVRKMASAIALTFSKVVDPKNPLYLDDNYCEAVDWEFGVLSQKREIIVSSRDRENRAELKESDGQGQIGNSGVHDQVVYRENGEERENSESGYSSDSSLEPYDLRDDDTDLKRKFTQFGDIAATLRKSDDPDGVERALESIEKLVRASPDELPHHSADLVRALVHVRCTDVAAEGEEDSSEEKRQKALISLLVTCPFESLDALTKLLYSSSLDVGQRILIIDVMTEAAQELSETKVVKKQQGQKGNLIASTSQPWFVPSDRGPIGAGPWREVTESVNNTVLTWSHRYEREIPVKPGRIKSGKSRKWGVGKARDLQSEWSKNRFPLYAAAFMLPAMQGFDKKKHGVDLLNRDFIVLGKLIYMLGVCMKCVAMHPEASALAPALLDMIKSRNVSHHAEAYVRRSVLFAGSCVLIALHPSYVASALIEGNQDISSGLEWIRTYALHIAESDPDTECSSMAMNCLQLHSEMALQTSRALESADRFSAQSRILPSKLDNIIIPFANMK